MDAILASTANLSISRSSRWRTTYTRGWSGGTSVEEGRSAEVTLVPSNLAIVQAIPRTYFPAQDLVADALLVGEMNG